MAGGLETTLRQLYFGDAPAARRFRYALVAFDLATIALFLVTAMIEEGWWIVPLDLAVAAVIVVEFGARLIATANRRRMILSWASLADAIVVVSLILPAFIENLGFLRVIRALRLLRSYHLMRDLRAESDWFRRYEDVIQRSTNLLVFIFIVSSIVYVTQHGNPGINNYVDALYFTMTSLTTTGYGDITLQGNAGRLLSVVIMVIGVSLFLRLLQVIFRPPKVRFECPACALLVHDFDAVHCKHCGHVLKIPDEGAV
ncbi:MAG: ion transporter [Methylobacteriaceae bacterium]|nr:ion transporter [Methylobacteriaceae bacterium]